MSIVSSSQHNREILLSNFLRPKQCYICGSLQRSFQLRMSRLVIAPFASLLLLWQVGCALNKIYDDACDREILIRENLC